MSITQLSTEILQKIYEYAKIQDLLHLAQSSKRNYRIYLGRRTHLLEQAMHNSYSPLPDLYKLVLSSEPDKSRKPLGTEIRRNLIVNRLIETKAMPNLTVELLTKMATYGKIADRWTELYPQIRWRHNSNNRRLLRPDEQERLRGAIYRYWTYNTLFHDSTYTQFDPDFPRSQEDLRLRILRTYTSIELIQLTEYVDKMRQLIQIDLYPSYSVIRECYSEPVPPKTLVALGWGTGSFHLHLVYDLLKYDPADLLHLFDETSSKKERMEYLMAQGISFADRPATLKDSILMVLFERKVLLEADRKLSDEDIQYGIIDTVDKSKAGGDRGNARYAHDASSDGSFVDGHQVSLSLWLDETGEEDD
ncbi:hypothetical protein D0Z07_6020 [Hyphodiscus hymeniophilus]|uniref:F-box domain-containing protein n=1 Tax=Hyphodiscus hymeniophilus TaxID=353542 RepID=A0A9P6VI71_9HELO|nr:hypothetical protein D0Z07_6020 [Hyphodiscus hymeniophilus]